jgi:predicted  nucleic acid-binding Zn-ribbon protein
METIDITVKILQNLQGDVAELKSDVTGLKSDIAALKSDVTRLETKFETEIQRVRVELRTTGALLDERMGRLHARLVESDLRATTAHHETQRSLARLMDFIDAQSGLEGRIERGELDISDIKQRVF